MKKKLQSIKKFGIRIRGLSKFNFFAVNLHKMIVGVLFLHFAGQNVMSQTWSSTGSMADERFNHTITLLSSGKVLVTGGSSSLGNLSSCELYDPSTGSWTATGAMSTDRNSHTATLLPSGIVLVTGGFSNGVELKSCELYDPSTGAWSVTDSMSAERSIHTATLLSNGKVLIEIFMSYK